MRDCNCDAKTDSPAQRRALSIALALNAAMFVVGLIAGVVAQSTRLISDTLDMIGDALPGSHWLLSVGDCCLRLERPTLAIVFLCFSALAFSWIRFAEQSWAVLLRVT